MSPYPDQSTPAPARGASRRRVAARLALCLALGLALGPGLAWGGESLETDVKATYLYKFAPFVDWPADAFAGPSSPFTICVAGKDPFGPVLDRAVAGQRAEGRPIEVRRLSEGDKPVGCHVLFVGGSSERARQTLQAARGLPVLTVTDAAPSAGIIDFTLSGGRVLFRIDDQAAAESRLTISSKLLSLALSVRPRHGGG